MPTLEDRIIAQLGRRKEMLKRIEDWEKHARIISWGKYAFGVAVAACLVLLLVVRPFAHSEQISPLDLLKIEQPTLVDFRGASPSAAEIDATMEIKNYGKAIIQIDEALNASIEDFGNLQDQLDPNDEATIYESELAIAHINQLRWLRIYTLVRLERCEEAIVDLEYYVTLKTEHQHDAIELLRILKDSSK